MNFRWILLFITAVAYVHAYPYGAPSSICGRVVPGHRNMGTPVMNGPRAGPYMLTATPEGNGIFKGMIYLIVLVFFPQLPFVLKLDRSQTQGKLG